jgi:hypothetical protein
VRVRRRREGERRARAETDEQQNVMVENARANFNTEWLCTCDKAIIMKEGRRYKGGVLRRGLTQRSKVS